MMMNKTLIVVLGIFFFHLYSAFSQCAVDFYANQGVIADTTYKVEFKNFEGYIFPENYNGHIVDKETKTFTLTLKQVHLIEMILLDQYNQAFMHDARVSGEYRGEKNIKAYLKKFDRQYLGFINDLGEQSAKIILAKRKGKAKHYFHCFDKMMSIGFGEIFEKNQRYFIVNLEKEELILP